MHVLGNSLGARIALKLPVRGRARSVVAIAPSDVNIPQERLHQGASMGLARIVIGGEATDRLGVPFGGRPGRAAGPAEGAAMEHLAGGGDRRARGLRRVARLLAHGPGQTVRYLPLIPGSRFSPLLMAGHAPQSDRPTRIARLVEQTAARAVTLRGVAQPLSPGDSSALR